MATVHHTAGDKPINHTERMKETDELFKDYEVKQGCFITGDFNEHLNKESPLLKKYIEIGFSVNESMIKILEDNTCDKMRSSLQYQVNKMKKADKSTKDAILG